MIASTITGRPIQILAQVDIGEVAGACARAALIDEVGAKIGEALVVGDRVQYAFESISGEWVMVTFAHEATADLIRDAIRAVRAKWSCNAMTREHVFVFGEQRCMCGKQETR